MFPCKNTTFIVGLDNKKYIIEKGGAIIPFP
jgi:hypothetical protein